MAEPNSSSSQTTSQKAKSSWLNRHIYTTAHRCHLRLPVCVVVAVAVVTLAVIALRVYAGQRWIRGGEFVGRERAFCCSDEAMAMYHFVNTSVNPCHDFFAYVCSDVVKTGLSDRDLLQAKLEEIMITGVVPNKVRGRQAADFLIRYHRACVETMARPDVFISSVTDALLIENHKLLTNLSSKNALIYMMKASITYKLSSAITIQYNSATRTLYLRSSDLCPITAFHLEILTFVLHSLNNTLNITESKETTAKFAKDLCVRLHSGSGQMVFYTGANLSHAYEREVWNLDHLSAALTANGYSLNSRTVLQVAGVQRVRTIHKTFAVYENNGDQGVKSVYLLWCSVFEAVRQFSLKTKGNTLSILKACYKSVHLIPRMWETFAAEIFTTPEKVAQATAVFIAVKEAVHSDCKRSSLFEGTDTGRLDGFFETLSLVAPLSANYSHVAVPKPAPHFADNLLRSRAYDFEVGREALHGLQDGDILRYQKVTFIALKTLRLPAEDYYYIPNTTKNSWLPKMATVGRLLAEAMWHVILNEIKWSPAATANIKRLRTCFLNSYNLSASRGLKLGKLISTALGLSSVLNAMGGRPDWLTVRPAWSLWKLSHAQLFYIFGTYMRCPKKATSDRGYSINAPLMHVEDFANAFFCPPHEPMAKHRRCIHSLSGP
ncbi:hypothetical protein V5799_030470 [Amblyomma americanum]|uniref:Uncharacterized protein n=1 Tax=Amblyomma americanum TaxID=6943 RepID=A0AAQ4EN64_AMBAM